MDKDEVLRERLKLVDNPKLISAPVLAEPLYACATSVTAIAFIPHAELEIEVDGAVVVLVTGYYPEPNGQTIALPDPLKAAQTVRARQHTASATSDWSSPIVVRDHTKDYPAGLPRPQINPAPVYECGARTGVANLLGGCEVWISADGIEVGRVQGAAEHQGINVTPDYQFNQRVRAWAALCQDPSPASEEHVAQHPPTPLPTPGIEQTYQGAELVFVDGLVNGARFEFKRNGSSLGIFRTWGVRHRVGISPPASTSDVFEVTQSMCPGSPPSTPGSGTPLPCGELPAPRLGPVQVGDTRVVITDKVPGARIQVFIDGSKVGESGGYIVPLTRSVDPDDVLYVLQILGTCVGQTVRELHARCVNPPVGIDPSALDLFPVGHDAYNDPAGLGVDGVSYAVKGSVYYPAEDDGPGQAFNLRLAKTGTVPIVFMAHGNHYVYRDPEHHDSEDCTQHAGWVEIPNHEGYDYFQRRLARMGIVAVSVYSNQTNCKSYSATNMRHRAELIVASIKHFQNLAGNAGSVFHGRVDFARIGLMGHSRGGEAVVVVPELASLPANATIASVISLAPTDAGASSGAPAKLAFMTILPAGDGDVVRNDGAKYYDRASPATLKCQLYVHHTNHNFFNRQWPKDESKGPPVMSRYEHERVLLAYGCAFFRSTLLGHGLSAYLEGRLLPAGVATGNVQISCERAKAITVDHHEDANTIARNSLGGATQQTGSLGADEYAFGQSGAPQFNNSFFGRTVGMVAVARKPMGEFRSELPKTQNMARRELWVRAAEVYNGSGVPATAAGFEIGLEDRSGAVAWVDSDAVGGLPRPYDRRADDLAAPYATDLTKTMPRTLRFPAHCFQAANRELQIRAVKAVRIRMNREKSAALAFDVLQIV